MYANPKKTPTAQAPTEIKMANNTRKNVDQDLNREDRDTQTVPRVATAAAMAPVNP